MLDLTFPFTLAVDERNRLIEIERSDKPLPYRKGIDGHLIAMQLADITEFDAEVSCVVEISPIGCMYLQQAEIDELEKQFVQ